MKTLALTANNKNTLATNELIRHPSLTNYPGPNEHQPMTETSYAETYTWSYYTFFANFIKILDRQLKNLTNDPSSLQKIILPSSLNLAHHSYSISLSLNRFFDYLVVG